MQMTPVWPVVFLIFAGCVESINPHETKSEPHPAITLSTSQTPPTQNGTSVGEIFRNPDNVAHFANCTAMQSLVRLPLGLTVGNPPENWSRDDYAYTILYVTTMECEKVGWGPFERGPVKMVYDREDDVATPSGCADSSIDSVAALGNWFLDDAEIAQWASTRYGQVRYAEIFKTVENHGGILNFTWSWTVDGKSSSLNSARIPEVSSTVPAVVRTVWNYKGNLVVMDAKSEWVFQNTNGPVVWGTQAPPMLYSETGMTYYAGEGGPLDGGHTDLEFTIYGDDECKEPL